MLYIYTHRYIYRYTYINTLYHMLLFILNIKYWVKYAKIPIAVLGGWRYEKLLFFLVIAYVFYKEKENVLI